LKMGGSLHRMITPHLVDHLLLAFEFFDLQVVGILKTLFRWLHFIVLGVTAHQILRTTDCISE